jgi:putative ABC transport system ATP-binding protein
MMNKSLNNVLATQQITKQVPALDGSRHKTLDILTGVNLEIKPGETVAILGASGSGKSTLLGLLAGLDTPSSGGIQLADSWINQLDEDGRAELRARHVGFVFQSFQLLPGLSALENVMLPLELKADRRARDKATELLQRVGLGERLNHYPRQLSGGEQQRVAIARAFVTQPSILFADEPTGNLDPTTGRKIIDLLLELNQELNTTLVLVTHDDNLSRQCQRRLYLENGKLTETGS